MGHFSCQSSGLPADQVKTFKLSVSAACRKMSADQILDLADHLHAIIRRRDTARLSSKPSRFERPVTAAPQELRQ